MAHAAVVSLMLTLEQIRHGDGVSDPCEIQLLEPLSRKLCFLLDFIEESSQSSREEVKSLERKIRDVAYHGEDVFESCMSDRLLSKPQNHSANMLSAENHHLVLQKIMTEIDSIIEEVKEIDDVRGEHNFQPRNILPSRPPAPSGQTTMVGFAQDLMQIKDRVCDEQQSKLQILPIVGMGGMGKTTITMNVYNDSCIKERFEIRAWVTLSQQHRTRDILLSLLDDIIDPDHIHEFDDDLLKGHLHKNLKGMRYLIVVDDVRSIDVWNDIKMLFPDDKNGSRIILTSRLKDVADCVTSNAQHQMRFLNEKESWDLFLEKVFGKENCPHDLVDAGTELVKKCQGLPLRIVVIGGLLSKVNKAKDFWEYVAKNLSSVVEEEDAQCSEILTFSYKCLPAHLKACFLYMGVFPENYEIPVSRLIKLWVAEGFLKPHEPKHLEEVAQEYLGDLIDRNLILVHKNSSINGKVKTCIMHGLLRELCVRMAHKEEFLCVKSRYPWAFPEEETLERQRRLSIHDDSSYSPNEEDMTMQSMSLVRSFIYTGRELHSCYCFGYRLLRVLDMVGVRLKKFPDEILQLVNLRYIAITCHGEIPPSIALLKNLLTLVVEDLWGTVVHLPEEIFNMPQLRHLKLSRVSLLPGFSSPLTDSDKSFILENLETLSEVQDLGETKHFLEKIPNVKKLGIRYHIHTWKTYDIHLQKLETLKVFFGSPTNEIFLRSITCAPRLKKITLERGRIDWKHMTIFGMLPNLEVLKLRPFAFVGPEWEPTEGEFLKLKFLLIQETDLKHWRADDTHFPRLEHLILQKCPKLVEIPSCIGDIHTLETIEIDNSSPSAFKSAKDILEEQRSLGNYSLEVLFHQMKEGLYILKIRIEQDESGHFQKRETSLGRLRKLPGILDDIKVKTKVMEVVSSISGVESLTIDNERKILTVVGRYDPNEVVEEIDNIMSS